MKRGLWRRIKEVALTDVTVLVRGLDHDTLEAVERVLVEADFGPAAFEICEELEQKLRRGTLKSTAAVRTWLRDRIADYLPMTNDPGQLHIGDGSCPGIILVLGVNGVGKTTSIAKLAARLQREGKSVLLAAADTYRAGAREQLAVWAARMGIEYVGGTQAGDPAAVAFDAIEAAKARQIDVVVIDTAGRLHTHGDLMDELKKIARVVARRCPGAPHESLLVLDATVGQNALRQGRAFADAVPLTGIVLAKLDSTAKGGAALLVQRELDVPIRFVGTGEKLGDLEPFSSERFAEQLLAD
ncbi:MAG: signal recognition particle-docking protein FtsY [Gemmatimonadota bacterium]|nr:signal recognition particle-docking protein FtsY [Gemmatimonadota bacterium]